MTRPDFIVRGMAETTLTPERATSEPVAIMFVDQVGSTRQCAELGDAAALELHCRLQRVLLTHVVASEGWLASTTGDGVLASVPLPGPSITAACAIHSALRAVNGEHDPTAHTEVRVGIHIGTPLLDAGGMPFGLCVNLAARICALAGSGEVLVSDPVQALLAPTERRFVAPRARHAARCPTSHLALAARRVVDPTERDRRGHQRAEGVNQRPAGEWLLHTGPGRQRCPHTGGSTAADSGCLTAQPHCGPRDRVAVKPTK